MAKWVDTIRSIFKGHAIAGGENANRVWDILEPKRYNQSFLDIFPINLLIGNLLLKFLSGQMK